MAAKKVDALEEKWEAGIGSLKATIDERSNNIQQQFSSLEAMLLILTKLHLNPPLVVLTRQGGVAREGSGDTKLVLVDGIEGRGSRTTSLAQLGATVHGGLGGGKVGPGDLRPKGFPGVGCSEGSWVVVDLRVTWLEEAV